MSLISLCMIVKNESHNLSRCLDSVKDLVDEMIVVDTGSTDNTVDIAKGYGAKVGFFEWCDDFAAARNHSLSLASGDWILVLDADEELVIGEGVSIQDIRHFLQNSLDSDTDSCGIRLRDIHDKESSGDCYMMRLLRNRANLKFTGVFHEWVHCQFPQYLQEINILHYGYSKELLDKKRKRRNIPLLEKAYQEGNLDINLLICLANMYRNIGDTQKAEKYLAEVWEQLLPYLVNSTIPPNSSYIPLYLTEQCHRALQVDDIDTASLIVQYSEVHFFRYPPLIYLAGVTLSRIGFLLGAMAYYEKCLQIQDTSFISSYEFDRAYITYYPAYDLGCIHHKKGNMQEAIRLFQLALDFNSDFEEAREYLQALLSK